MMSLSKKNDENSKSFGQKFFTGFAVCVSVGLLIAITVVGLSVPALIRLDEWMDNVKHQAYTFIALTVIVFLFVVYMKWGKK